MSIPSKTMVVPVYLLRKTINSSMYFSVSRGVMSRAGTLRSVVTTFARRGTTGLPDGSDVVGDDVGSTVVVGESVLGPTGAGVCPMIGLPVGNPAGSAVVGPVEGLKVEFWLKQVLRWTIRGSTKIILCTRRI